MLGLGVPTTANYVLVATLMAPVVVELGAQSGLIIPLIAVHLFVFYYGIMGDITPPVGLATFAAAAISGEDAIKTGIQGSVYALRTVILPFIWIFNPQLLLIDVHGSWELISVVLACTLATLLFAALTMGWFRVKNRWWESALIAIAVVLLFRPDFFMDRITPEFKDVPAAQLFEVAKTTDDNERVMVVIKGSTIEGDEVVKTVALQLGAAGAEGRKRLTDAGLTVVPLGGQVLMARCGPQTLRLCNPSDAGVAGHDLGAAGRVAMSAPQAVRHSAAHPHSESSPCCHLCVTGCWPCRPCSPPLPACPPLPPMPPFPSLRPDPAAWWMSPGCSKTARRCCCWTPP